MVDYYPDIPIFPPPKLPSGVCRLCGKPTNRKVWLDKKRVEYWHVKCEKKIHVISKNEALRSNAKPNSWRNYPSIFTS